MPLGSETPDVCFQGDLQECLVSQWMKTMAFVGMIKFFFQVTGKTMDKQSKKNKVIKTYENIFRKACASNWKNSFFPTAFYSDMLQAPVLPLMSLCECFFWTQINLNLTGKRCKAKHTRWHQIMINYASQNWKKKKKKKNDLGDSKKMAPNWWTTPRHVLRIGQAQLVPPLRVGWSTFTMRSSEPWQWKLDEVGGCGKTPAPRNAAYPQGRVESCEMSCLDDRISGHSDIAHRAESYA